MDIDESSISRNGGEGVIVIVWRLLERDQDRLLESVSSFQHIQGIFDVFADCIEAIVLLAAENQVSNLFLPCLLLWIIIRVLNEYQFRYFLPVLL